MIWWIYLEDNGGNVLDDGHNRTDGGTFVYGGTSEAELNVTYNYGQHFPFGDLHGLTAISAVEILSEKIKNLSDDESPDYWEPTEGNVKKALQILKDFADFAISKGIDCKFRVS